jgi:ubiquinone/menaquinone biosynthesis C-methylase UbiE
MNEWVSADHALQYLARADRIPHRTEGEAVLLEQIPATVQHILDLGTGDGRLLALVKIKYPEAQGVALDFSAVMLEKTRERFAADPTVQIINHDLTVPLPSSLQIPDSFDAVISSFAIHHLTHNRKQALYQEIFDLLSSGGIFCNLEHVASPTQRLHEKFLAAIGYTPEEEDPSNILLDVETQLSWLRQIGFVDVDCYWKWLELALLVGIKA